MARTLIGELILRLKDEVSGKARTTAQNFETSVDRIERSMKQLNQAEWGGRFEQQLKKLGAAPGEIEKLRDKWRALQKDMTSGGIAGTKGAKTMESNFKLAALSEFAAYKAGWETNVREAEKWSKTMKGRMQSALKPLLVMGGAYTGTYAVGVAGRGASIASAEWQREQYRQNLADIPQNEQDQLLNETERLGAIYPSVPMTDIAQMGRKLRATMGDMDRALQLLADMVRAQVTLQTTSDRPQQASGELDSFIRGLDVAGLNTPGQAGVESIRTVLEGWIRASQVEGNDISVETFLQLARLGKIAIPSLSDRFLATAPAFVQDQGAPQYATALRMAYQSFVIGSNAAASKVNLEEQKRIGVRTGPGKGELVQDELFSTDPYEWVKQVLIPALEADGVDASGGVETQKAVAKLARNSSATGLIMRMIQQQEQVDKNIALYDRAVGTSAAEDARYNDPFVAMRGFVESLRNLSAAVGEDAMPPVVKFLNNMADGINRFQQAYRDGDMEAKLGLAAGVGATAFGGYKIGQAVLGLTTAGTNLNAAAASLQSAAASLQGSGAAGAAGAPGGKSKGAGIGKTATNWFGIVGLIDTLGKMQVADFEKARQNGEALNATLENKVGTPGEWLLGAGWRDKISRFLWGDAADENFSFRDAMKIDAGVTGSKKGATSPYLEELDRYKEKAVETGEDVQSSLSVTAKPEIDDSSLRSTLALANALRSALSAIDVATGEIARKADTKLSREMNRNFSDHGVAP